ncbi:GNAT family N-acetyltransferase [Paenibacillus yanchengensis]|uniref:GNAT family N-acetyltransferase n=1 Tax=Paenibacillus yanchengensis TaxID=2035833 RepID=A0ABW4YG30_9BACL
MVIVEFEEADTEEIVSLFYETVHSVNAKGYSQIELNAWAPLEEKTAKLAAWKVSLGRNLSYVAKVDNQVVGFSDMTHSGYLDRLYVHHCYQGQGIATALVDRLENEAKKINLLEIATDASITAKQFFERRGFMTTCPQTVERKGVKLINYKMIKKLDS